MWFSQPTTTGVEPTNNAPETRTYNIFVNEGPHDYTRYFPWRAPGYAPVIGSGCGRAGGGPVRMMNGGTAKEFGLDQDMDGLDLPIVSHTVWHRGEAVEVAWAVNANHGGGYMYRLCPADGNITEACFQRNPLYFSGDTQWLQWQQQWGGNHSTVSRVEIPRVIVANGTNPKGSQWARNPIPSCRICPAGYDWGSCQGSDCAGCCATVKMPPHIRINETWWRTQDCPAMCGGNGLQGSCPSGQTHFPEPVPGLSSLWSSWLWCDAPAAAGKFGDSPHDMPCSNTTMMRINIVDKVQVPSSLKPGNYVISWRWDSEQTNQIWQNCGDITIV